MQVDVWCKTDRGLRRESNQDSFLIDRDLGLFIVADGMGGHSGGEVASKLAVDVSQEVMAGLKKLSQPPSPREMIFKAYEQASHRIFDESKQNPRLAGMGTTMVLTLVWGQSLFIGNVGDSRAYLQRGSMLWQLTEDHSLVNEQIRAGLIREDQVKQVIGKNVITRSVGYERDVAVDILERPLRPGDHFLLCSDGLTGLVSDDRISDLLTSTPADQVCERCVEAALAGGGDDNVTVLFIQVT